MKILAAAAIAAGLMVSGSANAAQVFFEGFDGYDTSALAHGAQASPVSSTSGNSFTTDYGFRSGAAVGPTPGNSQSNPNSMYDEGTWSIGVNPNAIHDLWKSLPDNIDPMLMLNGKTLGPNDPPANSWTSNGFAVAAGNYNYSFDLMNLCCESFVGVSSVLQFLFTDADGNQQQIVGLTVATPVTPGVFVHENGNFTISQAGTIHVGLIDRQGAASGNDFGVDNIAVSTGTLGVPEPATWSMMLLGFGGLGAMIRSQRRRQAIAA
jgi:hypothetical protein